MDNSPLTSAELADINARSRRMVAYKSIGLSGLEVLLVSNLLLARGPINCSALSVLVGVTRRSVREALLDLEVIGLCHRLEDGWVLNDIGRTTFTAIYRDGVLIGSGQALGFSSELKEHLKSLPTLGVKRPFRVDG